MATFFIIDNPGPIGRFVHNYWEAHLCSTCALRLGCPDRNQDTCSEGKRCVEGTLPKEVEREAYLHNCRKYKRVEAEKLITTKDLQVEYGNNLRLYGPPLHPLPLYFRKNWAKNVKGAGDEVLVFDVLPLELRFVKQLFPEPAGHNIIGISSQTYEPPSDEDQVLGLNAFGDSKLRKIYQLLIAQFFYRASKITVDPCEGTTADVAQATVTWPGKISTNFFLKFGPPEQLRQEVKNCNRVAAVDRTRPERYITTVCLSDSGRLLAESRADFTGLLATKLVRGEDSPSATWLLKELTYANAVQWTKKILEGLADLHGVPEKGDMLCRNAYPWIAAPSKVLKVRLNPVGDLLVGPKKKTALSEIRTGRRQGYTRYVVRHARLFGTRRKQMLILHLDGDGDQQRLELISSVKDSIDYTCKRGIQAGESVYLKESRKAVGIEEYLRREFEQACRKFPDYAGLREDLFGDAFKTCFGLLGKKTTAALGEYVHGDLHTRNILVTDAEGHDFGIADFADLEERLPLSWDYANFELSLRLHWVLEDPKPIRLKYHSMFGPMYDHFFVGLEGWVLSQKNDDIPFTGSERNKPELKKLFDKCQALYDMIDILREAHKQRAQEAGLTKGERTRDYFTSLFFAALGFYTVPTPFDCVEEKYMEIAWRTAVAKSALQMMRSVKLPSE